MRTRTLTLLAPVLFALGCAGARSATARPDAPVATQSSTRVAGDSGRLPTISDLEHAFERAAGRVAPAVVSITSERPVGDELPPFLRQFGPPDGHVRGMGSGVLIDKEGHILTNNHVVADADALIVRTNDDRVFKAKVIGTDPKTDLAVIRIDGDRLKPASLGNSDQLRVGQWVMAAGSPFGLQRSVTAGIISAVGRGSMGITDYGDFIQTDAAVNQGNSGGPLIDLEGRVIGINTAIASSSGGSNGIGFTIPVNLAQVVATQLIEHGSVSRGWLGVVMGKLTPQLADSFGYRGGGGILINDVDGKGPASAAGVHPGDIVTHLRGRPVKEMSQFRNEIAQTRPGNKVNLTVYRKGASKKLAVTLATLPGEPPPRKRRKAKPKKRRRRPSSQGRVCA